MKSETLARNVTIPKRSGSEKVENGFFQMGSTDKSRSSKLVQKD